MVAEKLGAVIKRRRKAIGISQRELARRIGRHFNTIYALERGDWNPSLHLLEEIAAELGTTVSTLVAEAEAADAEDPDPDLSERKVSATA